MTAVPAASRWVKARLSDSAGGCVEVMLDADGYHLRDSKAGGAGPLLTVPVVDWDRLHAALLAGPLPRSPVQVGELRLVGHADGGLTVSDRSAALRFTALEVDCFRDGLRNGEFAPTALTAA